MIRILCEAVLIILSVSVYHSSDESMASGNAGSILLYGHPTSLQSWQLYLGLVGFGLIGLAMVIMGVVKLMKK